MRRLLGFVAVLVIVFALFKGISGGVENVQQGVNQDLNSIMSTAMNGGTINSDNPFSMFSHTTGAVVEEVDKGLGIVQSLMTLLLFALIVGIVLFIYFLNDDTRHTQHLAKIHLDHTMDMHKRYSGKGR